MEELIVKTQEELDAVPVDYNGRIIIKFGTQLNPAILRKKYKYPAVLRGSSRAVLRGSSSAVLWGSSRAVLWESSSAELWGSSSAVLWESSSAVLRGSSSAVLRESSRAELWGSSSAVLRGSSSAVLRESSSAELWESSNAELWESSRAELWGSSRAMLWGSSRAVLWESSSAVLWESSSAELRGSSRAELWESSSAVLRGSSSAVLCGSSSAMLWESSSAELCGSSSAVLRGNAQALDRSINHNIKTSGNARIVYDPRNIDEYIDQNGLEATDSTVLLYKAVHKRDGRYWADWTDFEYRIGETAEADGLTTDVNEDCGHGIHMAHEAWCVDYGRGWSDLAILELEVEKSGVIVPLGGAGKVRAAKAKVIREVPLEECGLYGEWLAKRRM